MSRSSPSAVLAVDIGGTSVRGAVVLEDGSVRCRRTLSTFGTHRDALASTRLLVASLLEASADVYVRRIGVAAPGTVDPVARTVTRAANLGWRDLPLGELLDAATGVPVVLDHDARAGARAELAGLPVPHPRALVFIPIGTGIAGTLVIDGTPLVGQTNAAGELGHTIVHPGGRLCPCGQRGCLEAYSSARSIAARYHFLSPEGPPRTTEHLVSLLQVDPAAGQAWHEGVDALALAIVNLTAITDGCVVIGGGLGEAGELLLRPLRHRVGELLTWRPVPDIRGSASGPHAALIGAALLALGADADHAAFSGRMLETLSGAPQLDADAGIATATATTTATRSGAS
ncbi:ROK family protein [Curtobacterium sp. ISL-83]|uniref:ROK family protein n=1 Tax=Curtobacterium sp. ISL-83 TaxID=2819145 RepID=UPI001BEC08FB|nr:ROK family protein [Curtobacterium sp. ISL-83]MBT2502268.1 ROK family protein [Curtobacterium sp. ISL-83]